METIISKSQQNPTTWKKLHSFVFYIIGALLFLTCLFFKFPVFSDSWSHLNGIFLLKFAIRFLFLTPFYVLPLIALLFYIPSKLDKTRISSATLLIILSLNLIPPLLTIFNLVEPIDIIFFPSFSLVTIGVIQIFLIVALIAVIFFIFNWNYFPIVSDKPNTSTKKYLKVFQLPYWLFEKASDFSTQQSNQILSAIINAILFYIISMLIAFVIFLFVWVLIPIMAYLLIWSIIIAAMIGFVYFVFLRDNSTSSTTTYTSSSSGCPFAGKILVNDSTEVLGFNWQRKEVLFIIDNEWNVSLKGKDYGWIDVRGQIREGIGGDPQATMSIEPIVGVIKNNHLFVNGKKVGELVKW